jgi:filamentous hemagglutinin
VLNRVAPDTVQALSNNITELQTRIGVTVDTVVTGDRAADVRRDFDTAPTSDNAFEVGGGKAVTAAATTVLLGSIARRLNNGDGADGPDPSRRPSTIQERREHHDNRVTDVANEYRAQGYDIPNERQATFGSQCGGRNSCRTDLIGRDPNGRVVVFEIKTGDAQLSIRQSDIYPQIRNGNAIPTGAVAENLGLRPGVRLRDQDYPNGIRIIEERRPGLGQ